MQKFENVNLLAEDFSLFHVCFRLVENTSPWVRRETSDWSEVLYDGLYGPGSCPYILHNDYGAYTARSELGTTQPQLFLLLTILFYCYSGWLGSWINENKDKLGRAVPSSAQAGDSFVRY